MEMVGVFLRGFTNATMQGCSKDAFISAQQETRASTSASPFRSVCSPGLASGVPSSVGSVRGVCVRDDGGCRADSITAGVRWDPRMVVRISRLSQQSLKNLPTRRILIHLNFKMP